MFFPSLFAENSVRCWGYALKMIYDVLWESQRDLRNSLEFLLGDAFIPKVKHGFVIFLSIRVVGVNIYRIKLMSLDPTP